MKTISFIPAALLAVVVSSPLALAQDNAAAVADPTAASATQAPAADHVIYLARLPAPAELVQGAAAQNAKIDRMDQSSDRIVVSYSYPNGRSVTFAYTLLSAIQSQPVMALTAGQPQPQTQIVNPGVPVTYAVPAQPSTVVYTTPQTVYYTPAYARYYDPVWDFWAPLAIGVGFGWGWHGGHGWYGGHGGWHGGHSGWHH